MSLANTLCFQAVLSQFDRKKLIKNNSADSVLEASTAEAALRELDDGDGDEQHTDDEDQEDADREAVDTIVLDGLDDENPELVLTPLDISAGQIALEKVRLASSPVARRPLTSLLDSQAVREGVEQSYGATGTCVAFCGGRS